MSGAHLHSITGKRVLYAVALATLSMGPVRSAETQAQNPLTTPGQTYIGIDVVGCTDMCPSYEIYLVDNGQMLFRANNSHTEEPGTAKRTPFGQQYRKLVEYISGKELFKEKPTCVEADGHTTVTLFSTVGGEAKRASYSFGCPTEAETARALINRFVNQSSTWKLINNDWEYWTSQKFDSK